jgi:type I restriction enzyme M protein
MRNGATKTNSLTGLLIDLIEHFSQYALGNENVNPDMLGQAYEYLIKHFADLTNKKAGEFYTPPFCRSSAGVNP